MFPYLERAGITGPPQVMWGTDDEIRAQIKQAQQAAEARDRMALDAVMPGLIEQIRSMMMKENEILTPMMIHNIDADAWRVIAAESPQIGYVMTGGIEGASPSDAVAWLEGRADAQPEQVAVAEGEVQLPSGCLSLAELTALLNTLPCDVTFVGADDTVRFFSENETRVFPRTRTIIGRRVADCHPPKSMDAVTRLVEAFRSGEKDSESFWIQRGGAFILIRYFALRDTDGSYLGVLETTEEISELRSLEGDKTLMSD